MGQAKPVFYLLAGPNGAGKSTLYRALALAGTIPESAEFVNADLHEAQHLQHIAPPQARSEQARQWADARRAALLSAGQSFVSETVFSHASKLALIEQAQAKGFFVMLLVVALDQPEHLLERVAQRVAEGGHPAARPDPGALPPHADQPDPWRAAGRCCGFVRLARRHARHTYRSGHVQGHLDQRAGATPTCVGAARSLG
jgi:predicted ABC-type ATPase